MSYERCGHIFVLLNVSLDYVIENLVDRWLNVGIAKKRKHQKLCKATTTFSTSPLTRSVAMPALKAAVAAPLAAPLAAA